jgi:hypothetical protein
MGDDHAMVLCKDDFSESGFLFCQGLGGEFRFNRRNGRFLNVYLLGYFNVVPGTNKITDESSDTPFMEIGKCSPF